ncbi:2598_t:CDS:2, partial [Entrophospora sp. SA101]
NAPLHNLEGKNDNHSSTSPKSNNKNNQISDNEKSQLRQYLIKNGISKISLENGKLVIEYSENNKKTITDEDRELKSYRQIIEKLPNQSLSLTELQKNNTTNPSTPDKNNTGIFVASQKENEQLQKTTIPSLLNITRS